MKWNFKKLILAGFFSGVVLLIILSFISYRNSRNFYDSRIWIAHTREVILTARDIQRRSIVISNMARGYVITQLESSIAGLQSEENELQKKVFTIQQLTIDNPGQQNRIRVLDSLITQRIKLDHDQIDARKFKSFEEAGALTATRGLQLNEKIDAQIEKITGEENRLLDIRTENSQKNWNSFIIIFFGLILSILMALIWTIVIIFKTIKRKEEASRLVQAREELLQNIIDNSGAAIYIKHLDGRFQLVNKQAEELFGFTGEKMTGKTFYDLFPEERAKLLTDEDLEVVNNLRAKEMEQQFMMGDELHTFLTVKFPVFGSDKKLQFTGSISTDITERSKIKNELAASNKELKNNLGLLETANKEMEAFSYSVSHDLRAPLRGITGFAKILKEEYADKLDAEGNRLLKVIVDNTTRMGNLVDGLLSFSRLGRKELSKTNIDNNAMVHEIVQGVKQREPQRKINWRVNPLPAIQGDPAMIRQVWENYILNAVKYTGNKDIAEIEIGAVSNQDEIIFFVKDNGAGFDMLYANNLFRVFQRLHSKEEFEGTGIGLANAHKIITKHGGRVWAEGEVDNGATFYFSLPIAAQGSP